MRLPCRRSVVAACGLVVWGLAIACVDAPDSRRASGEVTVLTEIPGFQCNDGCAAKLGRPFRVYLDAANRVWVLDGYSPHLHVFDGSGTWLASAGEGGNGPGQFAGPPDVIVEVSDDAFTAWDTIGSRLVTFDEAGNHRGTRGIDFLPVHTANPGPPGILLFTLQSTLFALESARQGLSDTKRTDILSLDLTSGNTSPWVALEGAHQLDNGLTFAADGAGRVAWAALGGDYRVHIFGNGGELVADIERDIERPPLPPELLAHRESLMHRMGRPVSEVDPLEFHFYSDSLRFDQCGRLWVRTPRGRPRAVTVFDIFEAVPGEFLGSVEVGVTLLVDSNQGWDVRGDRLVGLVETDGGAEIRAWGTNLEAEALSRCGGR